MSEDPDNTRYKLASERFSTENDRANNMVARATQGIGVSGTLMALFLGLGNSALLNIRAANPLLPLLRGILITGLVLFGIVLLIFLDAERFAGYRFDPHPEAITGPLAEMSNPQLIRQLTSNIVEATVYNHQLNNYKAGTIRRGYYLLAVSIFVILLFGVGLVVAFASQ